MFYFKHLAPLNHNYWYFFLFDSSKKHQLALLLEKKINKKRTYSPVCGQIRHYFIFCHSLVNSKPYENWCLLMFLVDLGLSEHGWTSDSACDQQQLIRAAVGHMSLCTLLLFIPLSPFASVFFLLFSPISSLCLLFPVIPVCPVPILSFPFAQVFCPSPLLPSGEEKGVLL